MGLMKGLPLGLVKGLLVFGFVGLGLLAAYSVRRNAESRRLVNVFIVYTALLGFTAGLSQHEVWPFSTWPLVAGTVSRPVTHPRIVAIDTQGREYQIDYRAWAPYEFQELIAWKDAHFDRLDRPSRDRAAAYLLSVVEGARKRWAAGEPIRYLDRYLGPFSAPLFLGHPAYWGSGEGVPRESFVGLRFYAETWDVEERARDPGKVSRRLVYEYRAS